MPGDPFPTKVSDLIFSNDNDQSSFYSSLKSLKKSTLSLPNRLHSILADSEYALKVARTNHDLMINSSSQPTTVSNGQLPIIANARAGLWYVSPAARSSTSYFKSTDGHFHQWSLSLRRLNLHVLDVLGEHAAAALVDSTRRGKYLPDALSKTVPIWVSVINNALFDEERGDFASDLFNLQQPGEEELRLSATEHSQIQVRIPLFVQSFKSLQLDISFLKYRLRRPIQILWAVNGIHDSSTKLGSDSVKATLSSKSVDTVNNLVLVSCSHRVFGAETSENGYIQGAADDSEAWAHGLTPELWWENKDELLQASSQDEAVELVETTVQQQKLQSLDENQETSSTNLNQRHAYSLGPAVLIKPTKSIFIAAGARNSLVFLPNDAPETRRPNQAKSNEFNLIVNLQHSPSTNPDIATKLPSDIHRILNLSLRSDKLGSLDLRDSSKAHLQTIMSFLCTTLDREPQDSCRILITCSNGRDLSAGVALPILCRWFGNDGDIASAWPPAQMSKQLVRRRLAWITGSKEDVNPSRATLKAVHSYLMPGDHD